MCFHWGLASLLLAALSSIMYHKNELFFFCGGCKEKILRNTMFLGAWHAPLYLTLSVYPSVRPSVCLSVCLSVCRSVGLLVCRSVGPSIPLSSVHLSIHLFVHPYVCLIVRFFLHLSYITRLGKFLEHNVWSYDKEEGWGVVTYLEFVGKILRGMGKLKTV